MVVGEIAEQKDVVIIGGGPGGYNAAIHLAVKGYDVTLIEKGKIGGVCLHEGCIPSKVFTTAASKLQDTETLSNFGIETKETTFHIEQLQAYKGKVVEQLRKGVESLCKANKIEIIEGHASFLSEDRIGVDHGHQFDVYHFNHAIIATGSSLKENSIINVDHDVVFNDISIYKVTSLPKHLIVHGNTPYAMEVAMTYRTFGCHVSIVLSEENEEFPFDTSIQKELIRVLKKQKIKCYQHVTDVKLERMEDGISCTFVRNGEQQSIEGSHLYISSDYRPNLEGIGADRLSLELLDNGRIAVDQMMRTSLPHVYAIGDVTDGPMLAVKAIKQAEVVANTIAGEAAEFDPTFIPTVVHSLPPVASVGMTEEQAIKNGFQVRIGQFSYGANGYATIHGKREGLLKVVINEENEVVLGFHAIGAGAVELISTGTVALEMVAREEDLTFPHYPHPGFGESLTSLDYHVVTPKQTEYSS
ncbi:dihydrolipoyl dehydrogenase family protein [Pontibacillus salicampi]|uniref:Dihydrolipoyl dehydrogenase family protein n=1 Tax=Pontibacillus salicampi TaxID=1449801 RepID=A0ABV6LK57_9BACI